MYVPNLTLFWQAVYSRVLLCYYFHPGYSGQLLPVPVLAQSPVGHRERPCAEEPAHPCHEFQVGNHLLQAVRE